MDVLTERVAKALAKRHGDNWDDIPDHKGHWTERRGQFGGRFRDINERFRCDYLDEAEAAIEAMQAGWRPIETAPKVGTFLVYLPEEFLRPFQVMYRTERTTVIGGAFAFDMSKPTHWMPLPAPPVEAKSEVNLPFERLPQHAGDPGVGPVPPEPETISIDAAKTA